MQPDEPQRPTDGPPFGATEAAIRCPFAVARIRRRTMAPDGEGGGRGRRVPGGAVDRGPDDHHPA